MPESLSRRDQIKIESLLDELNRLDNPELFVQSYILRTDEPSTDEDWHRMRAVFSGAACIGYVSHYLMQLRKVNDERRRLGIVITRMIEQADAIRSRDPMRAQELRGEANFLSGQQLMTFHFFAVCVHRISKLLPVACKAAGYKLPLEDRQMLESFEELRHVFEHFEDELPGRAGSAGMVKEGVAGGWWNISIEIESDLDGRIVTKGKAADVTDRGFAKIEEIVARSWECCRDTALVRVAVHFAVSPEMIPPPEVIDRRQMVRAVRF